MMVRERLVLLIAGVLAVAAMGAASEVRAQCYPGLACPTGATPQNAPEPQAPAPGPSGSSAATSDPAAGAGEQTSSASISPGYTCKDSKSAAELVVCQNQDLIVLDIKLNATYSGVQSRMTVAELKTLRDQQRIWVKERDRCGADAGCIRKLYLARLQQLSAR
jgi:uncharacterized protein YecT (DUF1311 family)